MPLAQFINAGNVNQAFATQLDSQRYLATSLSDLGGQIASGIATNRASQEAQNAAPIIQQQMAQAYHQIFTGDVAGGLAQLGTMSTQTQNPFLKESIDNGYKAGLSLTQQQFENQRAQMGIDAANTRYQQGLDSRGTLAQNQIDAEAQRNQARIDAENTRHSQDIKYKEDHPSTTRGGMTADSILTGQTSLVGQYNKAMTSLGKAKTDDEYNTAITTLQDAVTRGNGQLGLNLTYPDSAQYKTKADRDEAAKIQAEIDYGPRAWDTSASFAAKVNANKSKLADLQKKGYNFKPPVFQPPAAPGSTSSGSPVTPAGAYQGNPAQQAQQQQADAQAGLPQGAGQGVDNPLITTATPGGTPSPIGQAQASYKVGSQAKVGNDIYVYGKDGKWHKQ